ncbi:MAG: ABC transporter substrate-binding protein [Gemmatimonadota bacterium]
MSGHRLRAILVGAAVLCPWLVVGGCADRGSSSAESSPAATPDAPAAGGTVVIGGREPIATLNPLVSTDYVTSQLQKHALLMTLVRYDSAFTVRPYLAESWEPDDAGSEVVFHLRTDVRWQDGVPTTARDVAFTFRMAKDPRVAYPNRGYFDLWKSAEVVDDSTLRFRLRPHAGYLFAWTQLPIAPEHILAGVAPEQLPRHRFGTSEPAGNGPFRFVERRNADTWIFEANPEFPAALGGRPYVDRLVYRVVPDESTLLSEFRTGGVDLYLDIPPSQIARARGVAGARVVTYPSRSVTFIAWNSRRREFSDAAVRTALTLALDRDGLVAAARNGLGVVASGPVGPWHWAHDPAWKPLPHAPDSARAILESRGWVDRDGDGIRDKDGVEFRFDLLTNENPVREDLAVMIQSQLARVGIAAQPAIREAAALGAVVTSPERPFDAVILGFEQDWNLDDRDLWSCDRMEQPFQFTGYCNPALDAVLDSIPLALDRDTRERLYRRYHRMIARDQPYTYLYFDIVAVGLGPALYGVRPDSRGELATVREWWRRPDGPVRAP